MQIEDKKELSIKLDDDEIKKLSDAYEVLKNLTDAMEKNNLFNVDYGYPESPEYYGYDYLVKVRGTLIDLKEIHTML